MQKISLRKKISEEQNFLRFLRVLRETLKKMLYLCKKLGF